MDMLWKTGLFSQFVEEKGITNMYCSESEIYTAKSYTKSYIHIYMCATQRNYNMYLHNK